MHARPHRRHGILGTIALMAVLAVGMTLLAWPRVSNLRARGRMDQAIKVVDDLHAGSSEVTGEGHVDLDAAWQYLSQYNQDVRDGRVPQVNDPWGFSTSSAGFPATELPDGLVGSIRIPAMDVSLPLYLGSTEQNMLKGATVMYASSAPLGETDSNCVVAAHRGFSSGYMFNYIERLMVGDHVYISTPWQNLDYVVTAFKVVDPDDVESVRIQPGRDMVTLLTCHPHPQHTHRLLVYCDRAGTRAADAASSSGSPQATEGSSASSTVPKTPDETTILGMDVLQFQDVATNVGLAAGAVLMVVLVVRLSKATGKRRRG
jgi:sortase A